MNLFKVKYISTLFLILGLLNSSIAQSDTVKYISFNLFPLIGKTFEIGYEANVKPNLAFDLYTGFVFNSNLSSPIEKETSYRFNKKMGFFIKAGSRYNFRNELNKFAPFAGINLVGSLAMEDVYHRIYLSEFEFVEENILAFSLNMGASGIVGITSPATKRLNFDLGIQVGYVIINNLIDFHSYMPGMGVDYGSQIRLQGVLRVKYRIG